MLTALLIHVVYVFDRDLMFLHNLEEQLKVVVDNWVIESPCLLRVKSRWFAKYDFWMSCKEEVDPFVTWYSATDGFSLLSNCPLAEWMSSTSKKYDPINKDVLSF